MNDIIDGRMSQAHIDAEKDHTAIKDKIQGNLAEIATTLEEYRQLIHAKYGRPCTMDDRTWHKDVGCSKSLS